MSDDGEVTITRARYQAYQAAEARIAESERERDEWHKGYLGAAEAAHRLNDQRDDLQRKLGEAVEVVRKIADGTPREVAEAYRNDGKPSKNDKCMHGKAMWDECDNCTMEFAAAFLASLEKPDE